LVGGDTAAYFHYDGPKDRHGAHALDRRAIFKPPDETDRQWNQEVTKRLSKKVVPQYVLSSGQDSKDRPTTSRKPQYFIVDIPTHVVQWDNNRQAIFFSENQP